MMVSAKSLPFPATPRTFRCGLIGSSFSSSANARRYALDRERSRNPDGVAVAVRLVVEVFVVRLRRDGGVDFPLAGDAPFPPFPMQFGCRLRPRVFGLARDLPFLPVFLHCLVELLAQRFQLLLMPLPDHVDLGVVGDRLKRDVRHALVNEALPDIAVRREFGRRLAGDFGFLLASLRTVRQKIVWIASAHDPGAGQSERDARSIDGDPAAAPLLGDVGRGPGTAGRIEHQISRDRSS